MLAQPPSPQPSPLYLLCFQGQLNEDLLQLLIHKVDAELLKAIFLHERWKRKWCCVVFCSSGSHEGPQPAVLGCCSRDPGAVLAVGAGQDIPSQAPRAQPHTWNISKP